MIFQHKNSLNQFDMGMLSTSILSVIIYNSKYYKNNR